MTSPKLIEYADKAELRARIVELEAALDRALTWLSSYPGEGANGAYEQARAALRKDQ